MSARLRMITAMAVFGTLGVFVRNIPLSSGEIALFRALTAVAAILIYEIFSGRKIPLNKIKREVLLLFVSGAAMGFNWILLFESYRHTTVSVATLSYYFAPVIVMAACPLLFGEKVTVRQAVSFGMSTVGLVLVIGVESGRLGAEDMAGVGLGLGAAVLYASVILLNKLIRQVAGIDRTLIQFIAAIIVLIPYVWATTGIHLGKAGGRGITCLLIVGLVHTGIAYCLYFSSLKDLGGQEAALLSYMDPLVAIAMSVCVLGEGIGRMQIVGGMMILGFTLWNELGRFH